MQFEIMCMTHRHDSALRLFFFLEKLIKKLTKKKEVNTVNVFYLAPTIFGGNWVLSKARAKFVHV